MLQIVETINVHDVAWLDNDDDDDMDEDVRVKEVTTSKKQPLARVDASAAMEWELINVSRISLSIITLVSTFFRSLAVVTTAKTSLVNRNGPRAKAARGTWAQDAHLRSQA